MKINDLLECLVKQILRMINKLIPKNNNTIYMRSYFAYRDNIHAVLDELLSSKDFNGDNCLIYCDGDVFAEYHDSRIHMVKKRSIDSFIKFCRSKYVFVDIGAFGNPEPVKSQIVINTWHGVSLKRIGYYQEGYNNNSGKPVATFIVTYSDFFKPIMSKAFEVKQNRVLTTGEPRNDYFYACTVKDPFKVVGINKNNRKTLIWMPTYRQNSAEHTVEGADYEFGIPLITKNNLLELDELCGKLDVLLIIKWHGYQEILRSDQKCNNIEFLTSEQVGNAYISLYELIGKCDGLITDYSSIYINYLILNRPICFAYDDIDQYKNTRGFMFDDVERIMPGVHVQTIEGLYDFIRDFSSGKDEYVEERKKINAILNEHSDNKNSYRLLHYLGLIK